MFIFLHCVKKLLVLGMDSLDVHTKFWIILWGKHFVHILGPNGFGPFAILVVATKWKWTLDLGCFTTLLHFMAHISLAHVKSQE